MLACTPATDSKAPETIREFYSSYITEFSKFPPDMDKLQALKQKYCTAELLGRLANAELDADPFLNVQDFDAAWAETLTVNSVDSDPNLFNVCVEIAFNNTTHCVQVKVKEAEGGWKIDELLY